MVTNQLISKQRFRKVAGVVASSSPGLGFQGFRAIDLGFCLEQYADGSALVEMRAQGGGKRLMREIVERV